MHKIETILEAIKTALSADLAPTLVERSPVYKSDKPRVLIRQGSENTESEAFFTDASFELIIGQIVLAQSDQLESKANEQRAVVHKCLMSLQGIVPGMMEISAQRVEDANINSEAPALSRDLIYLVRYRYNTKDPSL
ncbi:hypothetical protein DN730_09895 [Marinomonas piezotolerans]|uniref:DUF3168 domain-containing protein n=1 Tax=Marinomonas piezotolerans TaxID=2213058 RepID=A0A370UA77_9GAMM|nr:hypothetical protein [Marinomonas piezotolerans]RDL44687.1 hypothetical protein DN730_09895 [Marinomonas piezotolerans]